MSAALPSRSAGVDVSFIVVSYNTRALTENCVRSILADADGLRHEVVVVDNGSADGSVESLRRCFPRVAVIANTDNKGFARANNQGMRLARGEFFFLLNSDAVLVPGCTAALHAWMRAHPRCALLGPRIQGPDGREQVNAWSFLSLPTMLLTVLGLQKVQEEAASRASPGGNAGLRRSFLSGCALMARRVAVDECGMLDERFFFYFEDMDWSRAMRDRRWMVARLADATAMHYGGASGGGRTAAQRAQLERACLQYCRKHRVATPGACRALRFLYHLNRLIGSRVRCALPGPAPAEARGKEVDARFGMRWLLSPSGARARGAR